MALCLNFSSTSFSYPDPINYSFYFNASLFPLLLANCTFDDSFDDTSYSYNNADTRFHVRDPSYYSARYQLVGTMFQGIVLVIGVLGNILVVHVVYRTRSMQSPTNCYLVSLAIADIVVLVAAVPNEILSYFVVGNQWLWGPLGCAVFTFSQNVGINASSLSLTAFTVERYIAICHPMKAQSVCTVERAKKIISGVWVFSVLYSSPWLGLTKTERLYYKGFDQVESCTYKLSRQAYLCYYLADLIVFYVIPLILSCILYGLIANILFTSHVPKCPTNSHPEHRAHVDPTKSSRVQVIKMLVVVVAIFATLWLPYRGLLVYNSFASMYGGSRFMDLWFLMFSKTCVYMNSAINPILYTAMSLKFRRAFKRILACESSANITRSRMASHYSRGAHSMA